MFISVGVNIRPAVGVFIGAIDVAVKVGITIVGLVGREVEVFVAVTTDVGGTGEPPPNSQSEKPNMRPPLVGVLVGRFNPQK